MKRLGERIKRKRESLGLQLNELAKKVGISSSALSQIEKAKAMPSISHLKSIATNLYTTVGELIGENEALTTSPLIEFDSVTLLKENESGCSVYLLSDHGPNKQIVITSYSIHYTKLYDFIESICHVLIIDRISNTILLHFCIIPIIVV